jgi:glycine cleavage system H protein
MTEFLETTVGKFIFRIAADRLYSSAGLWLMQSETLIRIGLSDFLQQRSGDIAFVELKPVGSSLKVDDELAAIETIKVNIALPNPLAGKIIRLNPAMQSTPEIINQDPYGDGWLCELEPVDWDKDHTRLLTPQAYFNQMKNEAENEVNRNG